MNNGYIGRNAKGELIILQEVKENEKLIYYDEYKLHPIHRKEQFQLGVEINFQYTKECTIHYPEFCECKEQQIFAIIIPDKKKSILKRFISLWK